MQLPNLLPKWIDNKAAEPEGSAPKGLITKIGVGLGAVLMAVVILLAPDREDGDARQPAAPSLPPPAGADAVAKGRQNIQDAEERRRVEASRQAQRDAQERARQLEEEWRRQQRQEAAAAEAAQGGGRTAAGERETTPEQELYQSIRLERIQRRHNSLRAAPVALSFRSTAQARTLPPTEPPTEPLTEPPTEQTPPPAAPAVAPQPPTAAAWQALVEGGLAAAQARPRDPRGWERIDGGQWIEAVLVTQIRGDAPGPAIALVSSPFWSRDRQRVLIPRGARFVGRAQAVNAWGQARLTVTFDRLVFDDYNLRLSFAALSQAGEAGLQDRVNRHYLATFGAAGAVGVLSGLTLRGARNFSFNQPAGQAARLETGRALGEAASAIMSRYLNRLPTITIRAGHRVRVYFTSDLLVPRRPA